MTENTGRLALPLLAVAQAQKEMTHNEALVRLDIATQAVVVAVAPPTVPSSPQIGQCWIVGAAPAGPWSGQAGAIAGWTGGGWRFVTPSDGMSAWSIADRGIARFLNGNWTVAGVQSAITDPVAGSIIDNEARTAIAAILAALRINGQISA